MITFYEGLPRSGKSFSAMRDEIIPRLKAGRKVFAYIEGLNHEQIAPLAGIALDRCQELLRSVTREQVPQIDKHVENDSLVVIDEAQNFWPSRRQPLDPAITQFVTEHGHRGLDIVLMGQSIKDVHALWRRRVESKIYFLKDTALGKPDQYKATIFRVVPYKDDVKFENVMTKTYSYDPAYFGTYKSHTDDTTNKETYVDPRGVIWNHPLFKRWLPLTAIVTVLLVAYVWHLFHGGLAEGLVKNAKAVDSVQAGAVHPVAAVVAAAAAPAVALEPQAPPDVIEDLTNKNRIRLLGYWRQGNNTNGVIEWRDGANSIVHQMTFLDLSGLGWVVMVNQQATVATLVKGPVRFVALSWPIDTAKGRTSETTQVEVSGRPALGLSP